MSRKISILSLMVAAASFNALAVNNGQAVVRNNFQQFVNMNCTGTIVGGKYVLTAAHCNASSVMLYDGSSISVQSRTNHPLFDGTLADMAIWELQSSASVNKINTFSIANVGAGQSIEMYGFGGTQPNLYKAVQTSDAQGGGVQSQWLRTLFTGQGDSTNGDSGAAYLNTAGQIVAVHNGGNSFSADGMEGFRVEDGKQFILDTVNGWHYPTNLTGSGSLSITVQTLHVGGTANVAYTSGDLAIDLASSTCDDGALSEYDTCTYVVNTSGGYGQLFLSGSEKIEVNKPTPTPTPTPTPSGGDSGGGSFGLLSILGLAMIGMRRKAKNK